MDQESFDKLVKAVMMAESGGRRYASDGKTLLSSPKGARGEMQVLDSTMRSPGYGVKPAQDDSPDERARVGRDVLRAMLSKYGGDLDKTLASYNWGPGNVDRWVSRGADFSQLPQETQKYISVIKRRLGADTAVAKTPAAPEPPPPAAAYPASLPPAAAAPSEAPAVASRTEGLGPGYQAALALAFLGDEDDREGSRDEDGRRLGVAKSWLDQEFPKMTPDMLSVSVRSPFPEEEEGAKSIEALRRRLGKPLKRADGGMIGVGYGGGDLPVGYSGGGTAELPPELSEEELKKPAFGRYPSSGKGRKQGRLSEALQSGEAQTEAAKGLSMLPFNIVGAPVDLATLLMRPFGYNVEKPVGGSDYLKDKARAAGLAFKEPEDPTLRGFFTAGDIASNLINPAAATRTAVRGAEKTGQAAKALAEIATRPVERDPFFSGPMGAQRGAIRLPGGHFMLENSFSASKDNPAVFEYTDPIARVIKEVYPATRDPALNEWFDKRVATYFRRDVGTERDPFVLAAERGRKTHHSLSTDMNDEFAIPLTMQEARRTEGMDPMGIAKTPRGQRLEYISDRAIVPSELQDVPERMIPPGLRQFVETDPTMRLYSIGDVGNLQFGQMKRDLFNMRNMGPTYSRHGETVNIPQEYRVSDSTLQGLTLDQASERVALFRDWRKKADERLAVKAIKQNPDVVRTRLNDNSVWVEPPDLSKNPKIRDMVLDIGCAGGWCTKEEATAELYGSGENRLAILLGPKGSPEAQLTIFRVEPSVKDFLKSNPDMYQLFKIDSTDLIENPVVQGAISRSPQFKNWANNQPPNILISEFKGTQNKADIVDQPYVKKIQEYVQNLDRQYGVSYVHNLGGMGLEDLLPHVRLPYAGNAIPSASLIKTIQQEAIRLNGGTRYISVLPKEPGAGPDFSSMNDLIAQAYKNVTQSLKQTDLPPNTFNEGGEAKSDDNAKAQLEAFRRRIRDEVVSEHLRKAADSPQYGDLVEYLSARRSMPEVKYKPGVLGSFVSGWGMPNRGEINLGTFVTPGTVIHELTHAADRQISQQYWDLAKKRELDPLEKQFMQTYEKLVFSPNKSQGDPEKYPRTAMVDRLAPEWAKNERDYRSTSGEMVAFGMGRHVNETKRLMPHYIAPPHVDATMATEFSILLDIAKRLQKSKPVTDKR